MGQDELIRLASEVIGGEVTEDAVRDKITVIRAEGNRTLVFCLTNGKETVKQWREHEIRHVWTEEMRQAISRKNSGRKMTEAVPLYPHLLTEEIDGKVAGQFQYHLIFPLSIGRYFFSTPLPFTE